MKVDALSLVIAMHYFGEVAVAYYAVLFVILAPGWV